MGFIVEGFKSAMDWVLGRSESEPLPSYPAYPAAGDGPRHHRMSLNPLDIVDLRARFKNPLAKDLVRFVQSPPFLLHLQSELRQAEYFHDLNLRLQAVKPETTGLEPLLDARIEAARRVARQRHLGEIGAIRTLLEDLQNLEITEKDGWKTRKRARQHLAKRLEPLVDRAARGNDVEAALEAFQALQETGAMPPHLLRSYGGMLLAKSKVASEPGSLQIYIRCLEQQGWQTTRDPMLESFKSKLSQHLSIQEDTPLHAVSSRMTLLARMRAGGGNLNHPAKSLGLGYLLLEQPGRAIPHLEQACETDGHDKGETYYYLAQSLYRTDQHARAAAAFEQAGRLGYSRSRIMAWQGLALAKSGQWAAAYELFREAEENLGPEADAAFFLYWARACYRMGAIDQAKMRYQEAIHRSRAKAGAKTATVHDHVRAEYGLAVCLLQEGQLGEAGARLQNALGMGRQFAPAWHLSGRLHELQGARDRAVQCYRAAVEANPEDLVYLLSLSLALDTEKDSEALPLLRRVIEAGKGGLEVMRRLAVGYHARGQHPTARAWFGRLVEELPANVECMRWVSRYAAAEATESFNRGAFVEARELWEQVFSVMPGESVAKSLGLALLFDASVRLKSEWSTDAESVWQEIVRAQQLAPCWESKYLTALALLLRGDYPAAKAEFDALDDGTENCAAVRLLALLARYLGGDETAANEFHTLEGSPRLASLNVLVGLLEIQAAVRRGEYKLAAERLEEWMRLPDCLQAVSFVRSEVNALAWSSVKGSRWRPIKLKKFREVLEAQGDFWRPAVTVLGAHDAIRGKPGEGDLVELEQCDELLRALVESLPVPGRQLLLAEYGTLLRYRIQDAVCRGDLASARSLLDRLEKVAGAEVRGVAHLRAILDQRLRYPSHEKAYSLIDRDPDAARAIWVERLKLHPGEHASLEHLACLAWTRAYDAVLAAEKARNPAEKEKQAGERKNIEDKVARDYEAALNFFTEGLGYFRELYGDRNYWDNLRLKGRSLASSKKAFDEAAFELWKGSALQEKGQVLVDLAVHCANDDKDRQAGEARAKRVMAEVRNCGLSKGLVEGWAESFAKRFLDPDPTAVPREQFEAAMARAERVLKMDRDNLLALVFVVRGHAYRAANSGNEEPDVVADRIAVVRPRAEHLEGQMPEMDGATQTRTKRDLANYWEQLGRYMNRKANSLIGKLNETPGFPSSLMRAIRQGHDESERAFDRALEFDSTIALKIKDLRDQNDKWDDELRKRGY